MAKKFVGIRMGEVEQELLDTLQKQLGATQASVVAMALRELAKKEGIPIPVIDTKKSEEEPSKP
ncbi:MAG: hypothetical protein V4671_15855 [Armatimonadota bacterium]